MTEYLSKEEIRQWRSSLEKITLEEFASRLGKSIEPPKATHDIADIVLQGKPVSDVDNMYSLRAEKLSSIAKRAFEREQEISATPFSMKNIEKNLEAEKNQKASRKKETKTAKSSAKPKLTTKKTDKSTENKKSKTSNEEIKIEFKKVLTDREQKVFNYFLKNTGKIVYAKDLAELLKLPKDYVYKYIKNIRSKLENGELKNAERGGFLLTK